MIMEVLFDDNLIYIFSLLIVSPNYLLINQRIFKLMKSCISLRYKQLTNKPIYPNRDPFIACYLHDYSEILKEDPQVYKRYILQFVFNKDRKETTYICKYKYQTQATNFCEKLGLEYKIHYKTKYKLRIGVYSDGYEKRYTQIIKIAVINIYK
jgi:hypothetical protein